LSIKFYYDQVKYRIHNTGEIKRFLEKVIRDEKNKPGDLIFVITNDEAVLDINRKFLKHDFYTDVISFDYSVRGIVNGEIYISIDTIKRNANMYEVAVRQELIRVLIHGVLHLCGYTDEIEKDKKIMLAQQEKKLAEFEKGTE
jgi:probable rRNA maturation factor